MDRRLRLILVRLTRAYGRSARPRGGDPLDSLIGTMLSQNTTDVNSGRAFGQLKARFPRWEEARRAPVGRIAAAIRCGGLGEVKSRRIKRVLREIEEDRAALDLAFLRRLPSEQALEYLRKLPGVGPKTAACVLLFALRKPAFPVDTHVLRVSKRLGLLPTSTSMEQAHEIFARLLNSHGGGEGRKRWDHGAMLALHLGLVRHGRQVCRPRGPRCESCALCDLCPGVGAAERTRALRRER